MFKLMTYLEYDLSLENLRGNIKSISKCFSNKKLFVFLVTVTFQLIHFIIFFNCFTMGKALQYFSSIRLWMLFSRSCRLRTTLDNEIPSSPDILRVLLTEFSSCLGIQF